MDEIKRSCNNCRYYEQHYIWQFSRFAPTACGHCKLNPYTKKFCKTLPLRNGCEKWENIGIKISEEQKSIKNSLNYLSRQLNDIIQYLETQNYDEN